MKALFLALSLLTLTGRAFSAEGCAGRSSKNYMCEGLDKRSCSFHSPTCVWEGEEKQKVVVVVKENRACEAKEGLEAHEGFCQTLDKASCRTHKSLCVWN